ncbi:Pr6Pr family membrane protein [Hamadaea tsunoensis]|uniref:Pr6Pr family membrane protein n=1 Tax=Hamadaea tsunoensis TaxID=53368 RepID=UPI0007E8DBC3|nr:Pr6Pr family membrane protein [Hamadaea tsunoensis]
MALFVRLYRAAAALAILAAVLTQLSRTASVVNFFSFFTIQSNLIACAVLAAGAIGVRGDRFDAFRGAATTYMATTGIVFALLLSDIAVGLSLPWVNDVLHKIIPVVMVLDWVLVPVARFLPFTRALWWTAYPIGWLAYTMVRGPIADWYPYPFVDPRGQGYAHVLKVCAAIAIFVVCLIAFLVWLGNRKNRAGLRSAAGSSR